MQAETIRWEGRVELSLENLDWRVNPGGTAGEYELEDSPDEVIAEIMDGGWEI